MPDSKRGVVIVGATSAIAKAVARAFAQRGFAIVLAARDADENAILAQDLRVRYAIDVHPLQFDVSEIDSHEDFVAACRNGLGEALTGVVYCAGSMRDQATAQTDWDAARETIRTNFVGAVSILNRFANELESRRAGFICGIASVAGDRGRQSNYIYGAAKAGFATYLAGLRNRLHPAGVHVLTVKPGFIDTKMTWGLPDLFLVASPESAGESIVRAIERKRNTIYVPWFWRAIMLVIRAVPQGIFKRLKL